MNEIETTHLREIFKLMKRLRDGENIPCTGKVFVSPGNYKTVSGKLTRIQLCVSKCGVCPKYGIDTETKTEWAERIDNEH